MLSTLKRGIMDAEIQLSTDRFKRKHKRGPVNRFIYTSEQNYPKRFFIQNTVHFLFTRRVRYNYNTSRHCGTM